MMVVIRGVDVNFWKQTLVSLVFCTAQDLVVVIIFSAVESVGCSLLEIMIRGQILCCMTLYRLLPDYILLRRSQDILLKCFLGNRPLLAIQ